MNKNYEYPIELDWSKEEMIVVIELLNIVEQAYEDGVFARDILEKYASYKKYFKAKKEEKILNRKFEEVSGYSLYKVIKKANDLESGLIRL